MYTYKKIPTLLCSACRVLVYRCDFAAMLLVSLEAHAYRYVINWNVSKNEREQERKKDKKILVMAESAASQIVLNI